MAGRLNLRQGISDWKFLAWRLRRMLTFFEAPDIDVVLDNLGSDPLARSLGLHFSGGTFGEHIRYSDLGMFGKLSLVADALWNLDLYDLASRDAVEFAFGSIDDDWDLENAMCEDILGSTYIAIVPIDKLNKHLRRGGVPVRMMEAYCTMYNLVHRLGMVTMMPDNIRAASRETLANRLWSESMLIGKHDVAAMSLKLMNDIGAEARKNAGGSDAKDLARAIIEYEAQSQKQLAAPT